MAIHWNLSIADRKLHAEVCSSSTFLIVFAISHFVQGFIVKPVCLPGSRDEFLLRLPEQGRYDTEALPFVSQKLFQMPFSRE